MKLKITKHFVMGLLSAMFWAIPMVLGNKMDVNTYKMMARNDYTEYEKYYEKDLKRKVDTIKPNEYLESQQEEGHMRERGCFWGTDEPSEPSYYEELRDINETLQRVPCRSGGFSCARFSEEIRSHFEGVGQTGINNLGTFSTEPAYDTTLNDYTGSTKHVYTNSSYLSAYVLKFNDPEWRKQWHVQDYRTSNYPVMDHNVVPVYNMGFTGKGVTVAIVGEGIKQHPDLGDNYDENISYNFCYNQRGSTPDAVLKFSGRYYNTDGTSTAGVIAMQAGNGICGVGIAPNARIAGYKVRNCRKPSYTKLKGVDRALAFQLDITDIYCNTWLTYKNVDEPLTELIYPSIEVINALKTGTSQGRKGKGAIYIFSGGVDSYYNNCSSNGYINTPYGIAITGADQAGKRYEYSEQCTAIFATAYTGHPEKEAIATINPYGECSTYFNDSYNLHAGPPIAAGIIALVLEARPSLTYRDVMHIIAMTAEVAPLADNPDSWYRNGRGFWVSNEFGFGLLNAQNMVNLARTWKNVPKKNICVIRKKLPHSLYFDHTENHEFILDSSECNSGESAVTYLEHVELVITIDYYFRGAINVNLTSPSGTTSSIVEPHTKDFSKLNYYLWNVMSVHNWGEDAIGLWKVTVGAIEIVGAPKPVFGYIHKFTLKLHGTEELPGTHPRKYAAFRLPDGKTNQFI